MLLPDAIKRTGSASVDQIASANIHAYVGVAILILVVLRVTLRVVQGVPASPPQEPKIIRLGSQAVHVFLYGLLIAMPATGMVAYYLGFRAAGDVHADILKVILWLLIVGHVLGALAHHFYWKTDILRRMTVG